MKVKSIVVVLLFILLLLLPVVFVKRSGAERSQQENRMLAAYPVLVQEDGSLNQEFFNELEKWFDDHIGFRNTLMTLYANIKLHVFHQSPSEQVHIGKDGWYFFTPNQNIEIAKGTYLGLDERYLQTICEQQTYIRDKLSEQGIEYVLVLPNSKVSIYPEYLRGGNYSVIKTPTDIVTEYLEAHTDIRVIQFKDALLEAKKDEQTFYKTDTHWNEYGVYIACSRIIDNLNEWGLLNTPITKVSFREGSYLGELGAIMGDSKLLGVESCPKSIITDPKAERISSGERWDSCTKLMKYNGWQMNVYMYENAACAGPKILMFGDSMFINQNAEEILAESCSEFTYVWNTNIRQEFIDLFQPDIVVFEITERFLNTLGEKSDAFIKTPLVDYRSLVVDYSWIGNTLQVEVFNNSTVVWSELDKVRLCIYEDGRDKGRRAYITTGQRIQPGETVRFEIDLSVDPDLLNHSLEVGMLQEGITYFPERVEVWDGKGVPSRAELPPMESSTSVLITTQPQSVTARVVCSETSCRIYDLTSRS